MKFAKLSLAAIMAMGVAANAADVKVDGSAKLYYGTADNDYVYQTKVLGDSKVVKTKGDLFSQDTSYGDAAVRIGLTAEDLPGGITGRISTTYLTTMGLEGRLVSSTWAGYSINFPDNKIGSLDGIWFDEMYLKGTFLDKTTAIVGRQYLDTPMVFSEKWNIVSNSYDAAVLVDQHIEKTALVAAYVWRSNVNGAQTVSNGDGSFNDGFDTFGSYALDTNGGGRPDVFIDGNGAFAFGAVTDLIPMTKAQAWYYSVDSVADAYWLQADVTPEFGSDVKLVLGGQFAGTMIANSIIEDSDDATVWAVKLGGEYEGFKLSGAYSSADVGNVGFANVGGAQSKLYTEAWWNYGYVSAPDTDAYNVTAEYSWADVADFGAYYTHSEYNGNDGKLFVNGATSNTGANLLKDDEMDEFAFVVSKSFGAFDTSIAYVYTDANNLNWQDKNDNGRRDTGENGDSFNTLQVYLTYNF